MPVLLEGTAVVIRNDALERCLDGGVTAFDTIAPNAMSFGDEHLSQASFMSPRDAELFRERLVLMGLNDSDPSPDVVVVDAHSQTVTPPCDWLLLIEYKGSLIASLTGHESNVVIAPESWDPEGGSTLRHMSADEVESQLDFVRRDGKIDVYRDRESGHLLYSARLHETAAELYRRASDTILQNMRHPGHPPPSASIQTKIREAIGDLQRLASRNGETWRQCFLLGKAWHAVDRLSRSIDAFERAAQRCDQPAAVVYKELAGVLLEVGEVSRACRAGEQAVALKPDDIELLGNLAIAYVLDGRLEAARKTINHARSIDPHDSTNQFIESRVDQIRCGVMPPPKTLAELQLGPREKSPRSEVRPVPRPWLERLLSRLWKSKQRVSS